MTETIAGVVAAPGKLRPSHKSVKETAVEVVEDFFQMIVVPARGVDMLAPAHLPHQARLRGKIVTRNIPPIAGAQSAVNRLAVELGEQNMRNRMQHRIGRTFEQIGKPYVKLRLAQPDRIVDRYKRIKTDVHRRSWRARTKLSVRLVKNLCQLRGHG